MAPRGGKVNRTKKCHTARIERPPKRRRDFDDGPIIYPRTIPSSSTLPRPSQSSHGNGSTAPVRTALSSLGSKHQRIAPVPMDYTDESDSDFEVDTVAADGDDDSSSDDGSDSSSTDEDDDVGENQSDNEDVDVGMVGSSGTFKGRGPNKAYKPNKLGERRLIAKVFKGKLTGPGVPQYFSTQITRRVDAFWPKYKYIDQIVKERIWESFLAIYDIVGGTVELARRLFEADSRKKWRNLLTRTRANALKKMDVNDPALLLGTQPPLWLNDPNVWEQYVQHWCKEEQRALGTQARKNRLSSKRPDGKPSTHSLGSKGIHERLLEETGKPASTLPLLLDMNKKKDKATAEPTGETYNQNFEEAYDEYAVLFAEKYGSDVDPTSFWDKKLWKQSAPVRAGLMKGRILGGGYAAAAEMLMDDEPGTSQSSMMPSSVMQSLEVKNSELERDLLEMKEEEVVNTRQHNTELKEEVAGLRNEVGRLASMMQAFMAGSAAAAAGVQFTMPPVAPTVTASSLLASMHQHPPPAVAAAVPVVAATTDVQPPPPADPTQEDS